MGKPLNYHRNLTGIRAIAALLVRFLHFFNQLDINTSTLTILAKISKIGQTGVTLFFVLSGFLITRILLHTKLKKDILRTFTFGVHWEYFHCIISFLCSSTLYFLPLWKVQICLIVRVITFFTYKILLSHFTGCLVLDPDTFGLLQLRSIFI